MRYLSVCSGIEAASVAWHPLGWEPAAFCEIEAFPSALLKERYPHVVNYGDFTRLTEPDHPVRTAGVDLLVGGTPCQAFSVAGLRRGLADPRGGLTLEFVRLAQALRPRWIVWENVPGVLSQDGGRAFGAFLGALGELGYGWAYRVLDAQYVRVDGYPHAVPQRRRRVFVVGCAGGDASRAAAVLLEPEGVRGDPPTRRATRQGAAPDAAGGATGGGGDRAEHDGGVVCGTVCPTLRAGGNQTGGDRPPGTDVDTADSLIASTYANLGAILQPYPEVSDVVGTLSDGAHHGGGLNGQDAYTGRIMPVAPSLTAANDPSRSPQSSEVTQQVAAVHAASMSVRRLTPTECERLQGFPDGWTQIAWKGKAASECPDGPRYRALGNSMAVNVMRWIGRRIEMVEGA